MYTENGDFECDEMISLSVRGIDLEDTVPIKEEFVTYKVSVMTEHMVPPIWIDRWPHLQGVEEVELIIGLNSIVARKIIPQAIEQSSDELHLAPLVPRDLNMLYKCNTFVQL